MLVRGKGMNQEAYEETLTEEEINDFVDFLQDKDTPAKPWTDEELELLGILGQDPLVLDREELLEVTDAELTEWSEDVDILDIDTEIYNEG